MSDEKNPKSEADDDELAAAVNGDEKAFERAFKGATAAFNDDVLKRIAAAIHVGDQYDVAIQHVNQDRLFHFQEFLDIVKLFKEPGEADQTNKIGEELKKADEEKEIVLSGKEGVGKTWMAREVAARAVRDRKGGFDFDVAIWVYLDRDYPDLSLHESIAYQLSVLADFEEAEAEEAKKREKADDPNSKKKHKPKVAEVDRKKEMERHIHKALKGKKLLFIMDGKGSGVEAKVTFEIQKNTSDHKEKDKSGDHGHKGEEGEKSSSVEGEKSSSVEGEKNSSVEGEKKVEEITEQAEAEEITEQGVEEKIKQDQKENEKEEKVLVLELMAGKVQKASVKLGCLKSYKSLITTRDATVKADIKNRITVKPFTWNDSKSLASRVMEREGVDKNKIEGAKELANYFMFRSERLPAQLLLISRIVSYFVKKKNGIEKLQADRELLKKMPGTKVLDVVIEGYERLPKSVLIDRYSPEMPEGHFLNRGRKVSYNELICYWIMEGHLGHFGRVEEAYMEGHRVLMELLDCGLLQKQEADNVVATSGSIVFNLDIHDYEDFFRGIRPGLAVTFDMRLGKVALADGMIKTVEKFTQDEKNEEIISTLLLDGNLIGEADPPAQTLTKYKDHVEVLAISEPTSRHFKLPILEMSKLRLLALRDCQFLGSGQEAGSLECFFQKKSDDDEDLKKKADLNPTSTSSQEDKHTARMEELTFLEISGRSSLEYIPDKLFSLMPNLKTLNMSYLVNIESLPPSFYLLTKIEFLILRGCENLIELKSLKFFKYLKVLDVSEAKKFEKFEDKSLHANQSLQVLNLSRTKLKTLPLINQLNELKYVWLSDCTELPRIRKIDRMEKLQILDISGAAQVERFCDPSLEDLKRLVIVDISRTAIKRLAAIIGDPKYLYAKNCHKLKVVPPVEGLEKLQVLDLSGCQYLEEVRKEFFTNVKGLRELNLSKTRVKELLFLPYILSLRKLLLSECQHLKKLEKLSDLKELEFLDLSGCLELKELEKGSFDEMIHLQRLYLSGTGLGGQQKPLPSLAKLKNLKELLVRDCPNLTELPDMEQLTNLEVLDCSGTVLESPPSLSNWEKEINRDKQIHVDGAGIKKINASQLIESLGATQMSGDQGAKWEFKYEEVSKCKWNISNWRIEEAVDKDKLGTNVHGVHFLRLLKEYPSFLTDNLSTFRFLICPSKARFPEDFRDSYIGELILRDIYFQQICEEKMETCLEIRGFKELPISLRPLIAQAQFIALVEVSFLKSLIDLGVGRSMTMKACWIESCNELEHVVAAAEIVKEVEQSSEAAKSESEQRKNVVAGKGEGDQLKKIAAKIKADQQKKAAAEKMEEATKSEGDQQKNVVEEKSEEPAKNENDQQKNVVAESSSESTKGEGDQQKSDAVETSGESAKSEGDQQKGDVVADNSVESTKGEGDQHKSDAATEKSEDKNVVSDSSGESAKSQDDQQKSDVAAAEKSQESKKNEGDQQKSDDAATKLGESTKSEDDQQKHVASDSSGESAKGEDDQQKSDVAAAAADKSSESAKSEGDQQKNTGVDSSGESTKGEDDQQKSESEGDQQNNVAAAEKSGDEAKGEGHQQKNEAADNSTEDPKREDNQQKNIVADKTEESAKGEDDQRTEKSQEHVKTQVEPLQSEGDEKPNNFAENLNKLESLWISDVRKLKSVCKGDIQSVSFKSLKALYLEHCPELSEICSSSLQLEALETLYIKYCHKLKTLFSDDNPSKMEKLGNMQLWGLDSLEKIGCEAPNLYKLRVGECPSLEHVIASRQKQGEEEIKTENEGHGNLEILHIKSCDKLKSIFDSSEEDVHFEKLAELELMGLPRLQSVAREASALRVLRVSDCPSLKSIIAGPTGLPNLETLEVKSCEKMKWIIQGAAQSKLEKLKKMELLGLPELEYIGAISCSLVMKTTTYRLAPN